MLSSVVLRQNNLLRTYIDVPVLRCVIRVLSASFCDLLADRRGPCRGSLRRYFYNTRMKTCRQFIYGGCGGNKNNFLTWDDCNVRCGGVDDHDYSSK